MIREFVETVTGVFHHFAMELMAGLFILLTAVTVFMTWALLFVERSLWGAATFFLISLVCAFMVLSLGLEAGWWE